MKIANNCVVTVEYRMVDEEANLIDSTDDHDPLQFIHGHGMILPAIEREVEGRSAGERLTFRIEAEDGFGVRDPARIRKIPASQFAPGQELYPGGRFYTQKNGQDVPVTITAIEGDEVVVDGNHPLAGMPLLVDLVITEVRTAIKSELESGVVQTDESIFDNEH